MSELVLVIEDEVKIAALLVDYLEHAGFQSHVINDGSKVLSWLQQQQPVAILLDLNLPGCSGLDLCRSIRLWSEVPLLMITAKVTEQDRLLGLDLGADDYICKPFSPSEVIARVKAVLRRSAKVTTAKTEFYLDESALELHFMEHSVTLTAVELQLFKPLYQSPGRVFSRDQLMQLMYHDYRIVNDRTIDSHVKKLRKKLQQLAPELELIQAVYGSGYRLVYPATGSHNRTNMSAVPEN